MYVIMLDHVTDAGGTAAAGVYGGGRRKGLRWTDG
jgi:hypothetical protein